ncbi:hypothetical protein DQ238_17820 [Geodermatophilus sp. TF02-6]|uniref:hypothetical protein n=1 Tax=Geodermatophilus sp. TF02-6 TaxID=2250575 RepID=UPI000DE8010F|nr:hypothetical protein [Geodermatophilus sp. TF02-6]RBY76367.1 hypothetical protein DQ238_17820 [Geodermatophilus sp. TF02-6]
MAGSRTWGRQYLHGLRTAASGNALSFGFSIMITTTFGVVSSAYGQPSLPELFGFALTAVAAFSVLNVLVAMLLRGDEDYEPPSRVLLVATATDFLAVAAGIGAAVGVRFLVADTAAWLLAPCCAGVVYVLVQSVELTVGEREGG